MCQLAQVVTTLGALHGSAAATDNVVIKGVPHAARQVGRFRWRAPRPAPCWSGVRDALWLGLLRIAAAKASAGYGA